MAYNPRSTNRHKREQLRARLTAIYHTCPICGQPLDTSLRTPHPMSVSIDEIIPISKGGNPYQLSNLGHRAIPPRKQNPQKHTQKERAHTR